MSEPLTSHEIEDVLSSIRRLVSEDLRPARAAMAAAQATRATSAPASPPPDADKLLLTPALRVVPDVAPPAAPPEAAADDGARPAFPDADSAPPEQDVLAGQLGDLAQNFDFDLPEQAHPDPFSADPFADNGLVADGPATNSPVEDAFLETGFEDDPGLPSAESAVAVTAPVDRVDTSGDARAAVMAAVPPETGEIYEESGPDLAPADMAQDLRERMAAEEDVLWAAPGTPEEGDEAGEDLIEPTVDTPAKTAAAHGHWTAQDIPGTDWAQDDSSWSDPEPLAFVAHPRKPDLVADPLARAWADRAEAAVRAELGETMTARFTAVPPADAPTEAPSLDSAETAPQGPGLFDGDEAALDEETLREIVRDILREELAGTLGERITRNVRKLVRVEINRALAAREFE